MQSWFFLKFNSFSNWLNWILNFSYIINLLYWIMQEITDIAIFHISLAILASQHNMTPSINSVIHSNSYSIILWERSKEIPSFIVFLYSFFKVFIKNWLVLHTFELIVNFLRSTRSFLEVLYLWVLFLLSH